MYLPKAVIDSLVVATGAARTVAIAPSGGDDTAVLQAAILTAESYGNGSSGYGEVLLTAGDYRISNTIQWRQAAIRSLDPNVGCRILWDGSAAIAAFRKTTNLSFGGMSGINFRPGLAEPTSWIDMTGAAVDALFELRRLHFIGSTQSAIRMTQWTNCHWADLRFDNVGGYAILATPPNNQALSSLVIDRFTYDHHRLSDNLGQGVIGIDNTGQASNLGLFTLRGGRIEVNSAWSGNKAIFSIKHVTVAQARSCAFKLVDCTYQDIVGMTDDALIARETVLTGSETVIVENCRFSTLAAFNNGPWTTSAVLPPVGVVNNGGGVSYLAINLGSGTADFWVKPTSSALTDQATITTDASLANVFTVTLAGNRTLGAPTNPTDGQQIEYRILQSAGGNTLAFNAAFRFNTTFASPTLSAGAGALDILRFVYNSAAAKWECVGVIKA